MKATYLQRNRSKTSYLKKVLGLFVIFLVAAGLFSLFDTWIIQIISPVWRAENILSRNLGKTIDFFKSKQSLIEENASLEQKLSSLEIQLASVSGENQENALLELLARRPDENSIAATVLTHPPQTPYDILVIDAGANDSVALGSNVVLPEGPRIGYISEVFAKSAKVRLFSANSERTNAILERNNIPVELEGVGGGNFKIALPRDTSVEIGDRILSADISSHLVAIVEDITLEPTDSFKEILARSPANIFSLRFVFVTP